MMCSWSPATHSQLTLLPLAGLPMQKGASLSDSSEDDKTVAHAH